MVDFKVDTSPVLIEVATQKLSDRMRRIGCKAAARGLVSVRRFEVGRPVFVLEFAELGSAPSPHGMRWRQLRATTRLYLFHPLQLTVTFHGSHLQQRPTLPLTLHWGAFSAAVKMFYRLAAVPVEFRVRRRGIVAVMTHLASGTEPVRCRPAADGASAAAPKRANGVMRAAVAARRAASATMSEKRDHRPTKPKECGNPFSAGVTDALPLLIGYVDQNERYRFVNRAFELAFAVDRRQVEGRTLREVLDEVTYAQIAPPAHRALAGETTRCESRLAYRDGAPRDVEALYVPDRGPDGEVAGFYFVCVDLSERRELERTRARALALEQRRAFLLDVENRLRDLVDPGDILRAACAPLGERLAAVRVGYAEVDHNQQYGDVLAEWVAEGGAGFAGRRYRLDEFGPEIGAALRSGRDIAVEDVANLDPSGWAAHWVIGDIAYIAVPLVKEGRFVAYLYVSCEAPRSWSTKDVELARQVTEHTWSAVERARAESALRLAEETERLLIREVDHRAKNVLAVVQALVRLTPFESKRQYVSDLNGRVQALARAQSLLSDAKWGGVQLESLLQDELEPYGHGANVRLDGPPVLLRPPAVQPVSLIVHELATNAAKHGALSRPEGRLEVAWKWDGPETCELVWRETGALSDPKLADGFGSRLIASALQQLNARSERELDSHGLVFRMSLGPDAALGVAQQRAQSSPLEEPDVRLANRRVLVVEDEALVAMDLKTTVEDAGCVVVGPVGTVEAALKLVDQPLDCAILDVNLGGRSIQPVARALAARGVPHIYLTGYQDPFQTSGLVLRKPATPPAILGALRAALAGPQPAQLA